MTVAVTVQRQIERFQRNRQGWGEMLKLVPTTAALLAGIVLCGWPASADESGLIGSWWRSEPAGVGGLVRTMNLRVLPNGIFELRWANSKTGQDATGYVRVTGAYRMTGGGSYSLTPVKTVYCAGPDSCVPDPSGAQAAGFGALAVTNVPITGTNQIMLNGYLWNRED